MENKKIGTITFHASYNYGSNLQAYALQEYIKNICDNRCEYKIVNLRKDDQKEAYKTCFEKRGLKNRIRSLIFFKQKEDLYKKNALFERFINEELELTPEVTNIEQIKNLNLNYDYYISGSDQLWNINTGDFDWSNFLEFAKNGKKISYAASFGPKLEEWDEEKKTRVKKDLLEYDFISVREKGSFNIVKELTGKSAEIHLDPTMLLTKEEWEGLVQQERIIKKDYILLYNLKKDKNIFKIAKIISKKLNMPVIITRAGYIIEAIQGFERKLDVGPIEFLNLVKNAKLVLSSSFHGTVFSILFNKPFFAINGKKDLRIHTLLEKMNLQDRTVDIKDVEEKSKCVYDIDFKKSLKLLEKERAKSKAYLKKALDV